MKENVPPEISEIECINEASWSTPKPNVCNGIWNPLLSPP
uniref:Uncharacterized protein n=1 Tax=Rhizophora mucronata TaxID=61149 RepID=A0A2P2N8V3_RHIMU